MNLKSLAVIAALSVIALSASVAHADTFTYTTNVGVAILDNNAGGVSTGIIVPDNFVITSFDSVTISGLNHTWAGDLTVTLTNGITTIDIYDRDPRPGDPDATEDSNLGGNYTFVATGGADIDAAGIALNAAQVISDAVSYAPIPEGKTTATGGTSAFNGIFADFIGQNVGGTWTLNISDREGGDRGSFSGFSFTVQGNVAADAPEPGSLLLLLGGMGVLAVRRNRKA